MDAERGDTAQDSPARLLLIDQRRLVLEQIGLARNERFRARIKAVRDGALMLAVIAIAVCAGWFVWSASRVDGIVLEAFSVPPAMAQAGFTGEVVASNLRDRIRTMQALAENGASVTGADAEDADEDIAFEIPQTGISISDLEQYLRGQLGRQTVVQGEVIRLPDGQIAITVRAGRTPGVSYQGSEAEAPALMQKAAEHVLKTTQPLRYVSWALRTAEAEPDPARRTAITAEAATVLEPLIKAGTPADRAEAVVNLSYVRSVQGRDPEAISLIFRALDLDPNNLAALASVLTPEVHAGHWERVGDYARRGIDQCRSGQQLRNRSEWVAEVCIPGFKATALFNEADYEGVASNYRRLSDLASKRGDDEVVVAVDAPEMLSRQHDFDGAARLLRRLPADVGASTSTSSRWMAYRLLRSRELGDAPAALAAGRQFRARGRPPMRMMTDIMESVSVEAEFGDPQVAEALVRDTPLDCYPCVLVRARTAWALNDHDGARRWYDYAVRIGPSLPLAYSARGQWRVARGDLDGAIADFRAAQERGPRWADPLKYEADALMRQGKFRAAEQRYRQGAERAPRWGALRLAWGDALAAMRRPDEARAQWWAAQGRVITAAERAAAAERLARKIG